MQAADVNGGVHAVGSPMQAKQPNSVAGSLQSSVLEPEPEPEPDPDPEPLPLLQSTGHDEPFSPFVVSHMPLPHALLLPPLLPLPQSDSQNPISEGAHAPSPQPCVVLLPLPLPSPSSSSPVVESAHANASAMVRTQKIPALILIMAADGTSRTLPINYKVRVGPGSAAFSAIHRLCKSTR